MPLAILIGLPGPKPRIGDLPHPLTVRAAEVVALSSSAAAQLPVNFPELIPHVTEGELILVDDGAVALRVRAVSSTAVALEALNDGTIGSRKGANLHDIQDPARPPSARSRAPGRGSAMSCRHAAPPGTGDGSPWLRCAPHVTLTFFSSPTNCECADLLRKAQLVVVCPLRPGSSMP